MAEVLGAFDAAAVRELFETAGVFEALQKKGFASFEVTVEGVGRALPHTALFGDKHGRRFRLLDACVGEAVVRPEYFAERSYEMPRPIELAVVHWVREEDPTARFSPERPRLPLQEHPGLGVLRRVFRVVVHMATERRKDAVVSVPKFFHDAVIFFRSRLFLFLDGEEQGRFEALARDLRCLSLGDASLALAGGCVKDARGNVVRWEPGYQVFPIAEDVAAYFHGPEYATRVSAALSQLRFSWDPAALSRTREMLRAARSATAD